MRAWSGEGWAPKVGISPPLACIFGMSRLYSTCIPPVSHRILGTPLYLSTSRTPNNFAADPLCPAVSHCTQLYLYVSSYIQLYPAVSHRIPPPRKRDMAHNTLQGRAGIGQTRYSFKVSDALIKLTG